MVKAAKKIWSVVSNAIVIAAALAALALGGSRLAGLRPFAVLSGSMEPAYEVGCVIFVKKTDYTRIKVGDVITFMLNEDLIATHRVVEIVPDENDPSVLRFRTKGDANEATDGGLVHYKNIIGKPIFSIPKLGYAADYVRRPPGSYAAAAVCAVLLLIVFLPDALFGGENKKKKRKEVPKKERLEAFSKENERR